MHVKPMIAGVQVQHDEMKAESDRVSNETMVEGVGAESVTTAEAEIVEVDSPADQNPSINQSSTLEVGRKVSFILFDSNYGSSRCCHPPYTK